MTSSAEGGGARRAHALVRAGRGRDLIVLGSLAFVLRLGWVLIYGRESGPSNGLNDTSFYLQAAHVFASSGEYVGIGDAPTARWPPGFSFIVSVLYRVFGEDPGLALALNVVLATATVLLLYVAADRMLGRPAARVAAGLYAILPGPLIFTGMVLAETTFAFEVVALLTLALVLPNRRWTAAVLGVAIGLAALTRGEGLLLAVVPLAMWSAVLPRRAWIASAAVLFVAMALTIAPWTIRNATTMDSFVPISTNIGGTLWSGHNPRADGGPVYPTADLSVSTGDPTRDEIENSKLLRREAIKWAVRHPLQELYLIPRKLIALNGAPGPYLGILNAGPAEEQQLGRPSTLVFSVLADSLAYALLAAALGSLLLIGTRRLWRSDPGMRAVLAYLAVCLVNFGFIYFGQYRYRLGMEPFLVLLATPLLVALWTRRQTLAEAPWRTVDRP